MSISTKFFGSLACLLLTAGASWAGGPLIVFEPTGQPFRWDVASGPVIWNPDQGGLGLLSNDEAIEFTSALFQTWEDLPTASITYAPGDQLPVDVDTVGELIAAINDPTATPIVFDEDGGIFDDLFGPGSGVLGFAGPNFVGLSGGGDPIIVNGLAALNGAWLDGDPANGEFSPTTFGAVFFHEFGHLSGLDHSQVNGLKYIIPSDTPGNPVKQLDAKYVETMFPFLVAAEQGTPHRDDVAHISALYPDNGATSIYGPNDTAVGAKYGAITGNITFADGVTPLQGVNVIARNVNDKFGDAVAFVSGSTFSANQFSEDFNPFLDIPGLGFGPWFDVGPFPGLGPSENIGFYVINNLLPEGRYNIEVEEVQTAFTGGSSVGPQSPPLELNPGDGGGFLQLDAWNNAESGSSQTDNPRASNAIKVFAGTVSSGFDIHLNDVHPDPNEPNNDFGSATMLALGAPTTGTMIHPMGDVDVYTFTLADPSQVVIETDFQTPFCCFNETDTVITLYLEGVGLIDAGDDDDVGGGFSRIEAALPPGTYFLKVSTFPDLYNEVLAALGVIPEGVPTNFSAASIGVYSVSVTTVP
jgi:hypothetical protein